MFFYFYQVCLIIFLLQGISIPFLLVIFGSLWWTQSDKLEALEKELPKTRGGKAKTETTVELQFDALPKLEPLICPNCGGSLLLREKASCRFCRTESELPADYKAASSLKAEAKDLLKSAVRHWRVANVLTFPLLGWFFFLLIFFEPLVLFPTVLIGSNLYPDTWIDRTFDALGETTAFLLVLPAFLGFIIWMIVFIYLTNLSGDLRRQLPVVPVFKREMRGNETANCQSCGGGIEYDKGDFACFCNYCNVVNFRGVFARRQRAEAEKQVVMTKTALFGAMRIIEDFVETLFFILLILSVASTLLTIVYAIRNIL